MVKKKREKKLPFVLDEGWLFFIYSDGYWKKKKWARPGIGGVKNWFHLQNHHKTRKNKRGKKDW